MCLKLLSLEPLLLLAVVRTGHGNLKADREMLCCDDLTRAKVGAVLAAHLTLDTVSHHVISHGTAPYSLTTSKEARQEDVVTLPLVKIKMALEVPHLSCPLTAFLEVLAANLEVIDLTLEELIKMSAGESIRSPTYWTLLLAISEKLSVALLTNMMATLHDLVWLC